MNTTHLETFEGLRTLDHLAYKGQKGLRCLKKPIERLLQHLHTLPPHATQAEKVHLFKTCMCELNALNQEWDGDLLSTDEREDILPFLDEIAHAVGIFPYKESYTGEWLEEWLEF